VDAARANPWVCALGTTDELADNGRSSEQASLATSGCHLLKIFARVIPGFSLERPNMTQWTLASRAAKMNSSAIREILKLTDRPGIISMAGGLPSPQTFPISAFQAACNTVLERDGAAALQYSTTEGLPALRQAVADFCPGMSIRSRCSSSAARNRPWI